MAKKTKWRCREDIRINNSHLELEAIHSSDYISSCRGKKAYTKPLVKTKIRELKTNGHADLEAYRCRYCSQWHVGHIRT